MKERLANLIDLKTIITLTLVICMSVGFFLNKISSENYFTVVTMVITYYFAKKESNSNNEGQEWLLSFVELAVLI